MNIDDFNLMISQRQKIEYVIVYEDITFSYNQFGQRLGSYKAENTKIQKYYCTFYSDKNVIISLEGDKTMFYDFEMKDYYMVYENRTKLFFENPNYKSADYDIVHALNFHFQPFIKTYFQIIEGIEPFLIDAKLEKKYHSEFFIDLYAILKILGFSSWSNKLIEQIISRVKRDLIRDLYIYPSKSEYESINEIIWDELSKTPMVIAGQKLKNL